MAIQANAQGLVTGRFQIPAGVPAGVKQVEFVGSGGSRGTATFSGQGNLVSEVVRNVLRVVEFRFDPLAQTFSLQQAMPLAGVRLWFTAKGTTSVMVQIRGVTAGVPNNLVYGEARVAPAAISTVGPTQITFEAPIWLDASTEYALVVLCNDATSKLAVAELGKWDVNAKRWVTSQPYQVGVLLSSSNASTWTAHQDRDMAFELVKAVYSNTSSDIPLGNVAVTNATDLLLLSMAERPTSDTRVEYKLSLPNGATVNVAEGQPLRLDQAITGNVGITARLLGSSNGSPVLHPGTQLVAGQVQTSAEYVSVAFPAGAGSRIRVVIDAVLPSGASVAVKVAGSNNAYVTVPQLGQARNLGNGKVELTYELTGFSDSTARVKLVLTGTASARPEIENLRAMAM
jgi:hypothetical protein